MTEEKDIFVPAAGVLETLTRLKGAGFNMLVDLTAVDLLRFPAKAPADVPGRFELTYRLLRLDASQGLCEARVCVKCRLADGEPGPASIAGLWPCADWLEREVWDMFGVGFSDRPGIKRILMYDEFQGHPLRKDYPIQKRQPLVAGEAAPREDRVTAADLRPRLVERPK